MIQTTERQKILLVLFGVFLTLIGLEIILRLGGFLFLSLQEKANRSQYAAESEYRILCLGESTTALGGDNAYPRQLERILNESGQKNFKVINKGIPASTTFNIVQNLESYLEEYKPQVVISMIGVNDFMDSAIEKYQGKSFWQRYWDNLRVGKLFRLINKHSASRLEELRKERSRKQLSSIEKRVLGNVQSSSSDYAQLAGLFRAVNDSQKELVYLFRALSLDQKNVAAIASLGTYYKRRGEYQEAIRLYQQMLSLHLSLKERNFVYAGLGECYRLSGDYLSAEKVYSEALKDFKTTHQLVFGWLGELYHEQGRYEEAEKYFMNQLNANPQDGFCYVRIAHYWRLKGKNEEAKNLLRLGLRLNPKEEALYPELVNILREDQGFEEAEKVIQEFLKLNPSDPFGFRKNKNNPYYKMTTIQNYHWIKETLLRRGIKLVAVQYPLRRIAVLKEVLDNDRSIVYVDNEKSFQDVVSKEGYDVYFTDRFAGDFGHASPKGNHLLAQNIAQAILN